MLFLFGIIFSCVFAVISAAERYQLMVHNDQEFISFDTETICFKHDQASKSDFIDIRIKHDFTPAGLKAYLEERKEANFIYPGMDKLNYYIDHQLYSPNHSYCLLETTDYAKDGKILYVKTVSQFLWLKFTPDTVSALMYNHILSYTMANYRTIQKRSQ